jgi:transcriptional regulator with XRE-family HTH domain
MARRSADDHVTGKPKPRGPKRQYSRLGKRLAALDKRQSDIARVMGISQQSVSKKLRGEIYVTVAEIEMLAAHYGVPITHFFEDWTPPKRKIKPGRRRRGK